MKKIEKNSEGSSGGVVPAEFPAAQPIPEVLPILGLSDIVIFPGAVAPLLVDTPDSVRLIDDVVGGNRLLGLVLQRRPDVPEDLWQHGCAGRLLKMVKFPDKTLRVLVEGISRILIRSYEPNRLPYLRARIELLPDVIDGSVELDAIARATNQEFDNLVKLDSSISEQVKVAAANSTNPSNLADLISSTLKLPLLQRQKLLEDTNVGKRLRSLLPLIQRESEVLIISSRIQTQAKERIAKRDRELLLREQIRAIQVELGDPEIATSTQPVVYEPPIIKESLERFRKEHPNPGKTCFLVMKFGKTRAHTRIVNAVRKTLSGFGFEALRADDKEYHEDLFPNVQTYLHGCGFGIAILERIEAEDFNPNVSLEIGYMLAQRKPVLLLKDSTLKHLHTDLVGKLYRPFDFQCPEKFIPSHIKAWLEDKGLI